jgi:hypothetical protein
VPHDWEAQLTCFGMDDLNLVTGYYQHDLKTYLSKISEFSEFTNIVDYTMRESLFLSLPRFAYLVIHTDSFVKIYDFLNLQKDSLGNLFQVFEDWKKILGKFDSYILIWPSQRYYSLELTISNRESVTILES